MPTFVYIDGGGENLVPQVAGTAIGTLTGAGGLASAFDGNNNQNSSASARVPAPAFIGYVGKDWGSGNQKRITRVKGWGSNERGWNGNLSNASNMTISLIGSNTNDPTTATTIFTGTTFSDGNTAQPVDYDTSTGTTPYQHHWLKIESDASRDICCAEVEFYET